MTGIESLKNLTSLLLVFIMGGLGSTARYVLVATTNRAVVSTFPWGTLAVNILGSLIIGIVGGATSGMSNMREEVRLACVVGFLGGFTTFSAFAWETLSLTEKSGGGNALVYILLTNLVGIGAAFLGYRISS